MSNRNKMFKWSNLMWYGWVAISLGKSELSTHARNSSRWPMRSLRASRALHCSVSIVLLCILLLLWGQCVSPLSFLLFLGSAPASLTIVLPFEYCTALTRVLVPGLARVLMPGLTRGCCGNSKLYNLDHWTYLYNVDHHSMLFNVHNVDHWISHNIDNIDQGGFYTHCCGNLKLYRVCQTCTMCPMYPPLLPNVAHRILYSIDQGGLLPCCGNFEVVQRWSLLLQKQNVDISMFSLQSAHLTSATQWLHGAGVGLALGQALRLHAQWTPPHMCCMALKNITNTTEFSITFCAQFHTQMILCDVVYGRALHRTEL